MTRTRGRIDETKTQAPARAAQIVREYGPFAGADHIHGVTYDGRRETNLPERQRGGE